VGLRYIMDRGSEYFFYWLKKDILDDASIFQKYFKKIKLGI
jgi:hypothetical protein